VLIIEANVFYSFTGSWRVNKSTKTRWTYASK